MSSILEKLYKQALEAYRTCYPSKSISVAQENFSKEWRERLKNVPKNKKEAEAREIVKKWKGKSTTSKAVNIVHFFKVREDCFRKVEKLFFFFFFFPS